MTVNHKQIANKSEVIQCFKAIAVVREVTTAEWTEGIHQLDKALFILNIQVLYFDKSHFITTAKKKAKNGINKM